MHKNSLTLAAGIAVLPELAAAHTGHVVDWAGHDHIVAGLAIGAAIAIGVIGVLTDKSGKGDAESESDSEDGEAPELEAGPEVGAKA